MTAAAILPDVDDLDVLAEVPTTTIRATSLRECMVLVDPDLGTPAAWLDHRVRATRGSGDVAWLAHDLDTGRLVTLNIFAKTRVRVMATP